MLEALGGSKAFACLLAIFTDNDTHELKHNRRYTRFIALAALARLERSKLEQDQVTSLLDRLWVDRWQDTEDDYLVQAEVAAL